MRTRFLTLLGLACLTAASLAMSPSPSLAEEPKKSGEDYPPLPASFDLRTLDCVTPVKSQAGGTCWAHGTMAAIESHLILSGFWRQKLQDGTPALSEYHLDWWNGFNKHHNEDVADPAKDPTGLRVHFGGDYRVAAAYLNRGDGVVLLPKEHATYQDTQWYAKAPPRHDPGFERIYVRDVEWFTIGDKLEGIDLIKRRIMTEGAIGTCYAVSGQSLSKDNIHYQPISANGDPNHAVAIIGWDDNKVSTDPRQKTPGPGAWLIKNSWGTKRGDQGYYWISYYDKHCCRHPEMGAVSFRNMEPLVYSHIYFHDLHGWRDTLANVSKAFNAFTATGRQMIRAVSFYTSKHNVGYTVKIYRRFENGQLSGEAASKSGNIGYTGSHTINLDSPVLVNRKDKLYVYVELSDGGHAIDRLSQIPVLLEQQPEPKTKANPKQPEPKTKANPEQPRGQRQRQPQGGPMVQSKANPGESFYHDGTGWKDLYAYKFPDSKYDKTANFCIKALAVSAEESPNAKVPNLIAGLPARNIGPANMGGRVTDLAVAQTDANLLYVATATGGLWKSTDGGKSMTPVFDGQGTLSIGAVAIAPSNKDVVYVGTGEPNPRNSVSWGNGVYKSIDGGKTWANVGLPDSLNIGRIVVHPKDPNIAYVAVLGHLWGPNRMRGVYKTTDGGATWRPSKTLDANTGFVDLAMDPSNPEILFAAAYAVRRDGFSGGAPAKQFGKDAGLYRTEDGGKNWVMMTNGLPKAEYGRCGISIYQKNPKIVYAVIQTDKTDGPTDNRGQAAKASSENVDKGGVFRSEDSGKSWKKINDLVPRPFYYGQIRVDPNDDQRVYVLGVAFAASTDGGKTFTNGGRGTHADHHALWINPKDSKHLILGNDGGLFISRDQAKTFEAVREMPLGQFYGVAVDMRRPYRVYGGLQDNGSWGGPSGTDRTDGITMGDWRRVIGADGFQCAVDPTDPDTVYAESQYGGLQRANLKATGRDSVKRIKPSQADKAAPPYRFNWNSPIVLSSHDSKTLYFGGNFLFHSTNRGDSWTKISPDLTKGGKEGTFAHTITAIAESPKKAGLLYVGTDDGKLHVSRNGGTVWLDISINVPGLPADYWVSRVECSSHAEGTAYLTIDRHRNDDRQPYVYKTTDYGATWRSIASNLPADAPAHVIRESSRNKDLLFVGTENGLFISIDGGKRWHNFVNGLPPAVIVHDLVIHPRDRELVIGTHGRSIYVVDISPLEELTPTLLAKEAHLCAVKPVVAAKLRQPTTEARGFKASNPPRGAVISYYLDEASKSLPSITIADAAGKVVASLPGKGTRGVHQVVWNLKREGNGDSLVEPGEYTVTLKAFDSTLSQRLRVEPGPKQIAEAK